MADHDCLFCKIVSGELAATIVHQDEHTVAFEDQNPQAPVHLLVISREHFTDVADLGRDPAASAGFLAGIRAVTQKQRMASFRTVMNTGADAHQTVFHVHAHLLSGRSMGWPPG